jgi:predicted aspartyl protease
MRIENNSRCSIIKLRKNIIGMLAADIMVNNNNMTFIIDTGAEMTILKNDALVKGHIKKANEKIEVSSFSNKMNEMEIAIADCITIDKVNVFNLPVLVMDVHQLSFSILGNEIFKFDGILGWDVLSQLDFEIDYKKMEFRIITFNAEVNIPNLIKSSFPTALVMDEHNKLRVFGLDTGARKSWISEGLIEKAGLDVVNIKEKMALGINGKEKTVVKIVKDYKIMINNTQISFENIGTGFTGFLYNFEFDGVLGIDIVKDNVLKVINSKGIVNLFG